MNTPAHCRFSIATRALAGLGLSLAFGWSTTGQTADADDVITVGPVNVYTFRPPEAAGQDFDVENLNLRRVFEALGADATLWYQHVVTLSNAYFEGRAPGLAGNRHAAQYIEFYMREYGLEPAFPGADGDEDPGGGLNEVWTTYRQPFEARGRATDNVGGVLRGRGALADEWVIIGAHYDHVGYGNRDSLNKAGGTLHPGADDNASGTAGMLILAKQFAEAYDDADDDDDLRSILFMGFSAEEMGLLGSRHYVRNSTLDAEKINIMINLDMIGRLRDDTMLIGGVGSAEGLLDKITPHILEAGLTVKADPAGRGPSDHSNFYGAGIPVLFMFTGTHAVYHQPGDHGYTINPLGAAAIIDFTAGIAWEMVTDLGRLSFTRSSTDNQRRPGRPRGNRPQGGGDRASLGIMPEYDADIDTGVKVDQVFDNTAAKRAGIRPGDVILAWDGDAIDGGSGLMRKLSATSSGDTVTLTIERNGERQRVKVSF